MQWSDEQLEAIHKDGTNILVSAGAGSGKTAVLTERVIQKLVNKKAHINELLILTFTNAAAEEMKDRIRKKITKHPELKEELDLLDLAYITTFDSFSLSILKKYSYKYNLDNDISVLDENILNYYKRSFIDEIFDQYYEEENEMFLNLIKDFALKDDKPIKEAISKLYSKTAILSDEETYFKDLINNYQSKFNEYYDEFIILVNKEKEILINEFFGIETLLSKDISDEFIKLKDVNDLSELKTLLNFSLPQILRGSTDEEKKLKDNFSKRLKDFKELVNDFSDKDKVYEDYLKPYDNIKIIIEIINKLIKKIRAFEIKHNSFTFNSIAKLGIKLLKENKDVRDEESRFKEVMVDEYQDTSDLQEEFLSYITKDNLYMVGDIKQSIYGFRNANPSLFEKKYERYKKLDGGIKIDLNNNFRSREEVTTPINELFNEIMTTARGGAAYKEDHQIIAANKAYHASSSKDYKLEILAYEDSDYSNLEVEIYSIAKNIKEKINSGFKVLDKDTGNLRLCEYKDITILIDRTSDFETYKEVFTELNIPLYINADKDIKENILYLIFKNLYVLLKLYKEQRYNKEFNYAYTSVARSLLFEKNDEDIYREVTNKEYDKNILSKLDNINYSDIDIKTSFDKMLEEFEIYAKLPKIGNISESLSVLDFLKKLFVSLSGINFSLATLPDFLSYLIEAKVAIKMKPLRESDNAVAITNIHKSKGLEYPLCYFSGFTKKFNVQDLNSKFLFDNEYGFILPAIEGKKYKYQLLRSLYKDKFLKDNLSEQIRLFYVSLTRARDKMVFLYKSDEEMKSLDDTNNFNNLIAFNPLYKDYIIKIDIDNLIEEIPNKTKVVDKKAVDKIIIHDFNKSYEPINKIKASKELSGVNLETKKLLDEGTRVHEIFEYINFKNPNLDLLSNKDKEYVEAFLASGLDFANAKIYKEYEFITEDEDNIHGVIDLLLEYDDRLLIIDYKLKNVKDDNYLEQLNTYKTYLSKITGKKIYAYLYSVLDKKLEELNLE